MNKHIVKHTGTGIVVASLEETGGLLLRFDCVYRYSDYITQECAEGALAGCYEPTCQVLLFPYTHSWFLHSAAETDTGQVAVHRLSQNLPVRYSTGTGTRY
jgi:hypothetical protein